MEWDDRNRRRHYETVLDPFGSATGLGRLGTTRTSPNGQVARQLVGGQANVILLDPSVRVVTRSTAVINPRPLRRARGADLGLGRVDGLKWAKERRRCLALRVIRRVGVAQSSQPAHDGLSGSGRGNRA